MQVVRTFRVDNASVRHTQITGNASFRLAVPPLNISEYFNKIQQDLTRLPPKEHLRWQ